MLARTALFLLLTTALAAPAAALEGLVITPGATAGPSTSDRADQAQARLEAIEQQMKELAVEAEAARNEQVALRKQAAVEAEAARTACPPLTAIKYPWITCTTNQWGGKDLHMVDDYSGDWFHPVLTDEMLGLD